MSTEAVFGEGRDSGFGEDDEPAPNSRYGAQKTLVERRIMQCMDSACVVRTGSVVGERSTRDAVSNTYKAMLQPGARMAPDNLFTLTDVRDVANGLLWLCENRVTGAVHIAANPPLTRVELAERIIKCSEHGSTMAYEAAPFSSIRRSGQRAAWLRNGRATALGMKFADSRLVIDRKVKFLDESH